MTSSQHRTLYQQICTEIARDYAGTKPTTGPPQPISYHIGQHARLCDECFAHHNAGDVCICDCHANSIGHPIGSPDWAISRKMRNKLAHVANGNTTIVKRTYLEGAPILARGDTNLRTFLLWTIDLKVFCETMGLTQWVIGPAPAAPTEAAAKTAYDEKLREGLRYLCAMIANNHLKAGVALNANGSGVAGYEYLKDEFLQGQSVQSQYLHMLQSMRLQRSDSVVTFQNQWQKTASQLQPQPDANVLCEMFAHSITMDTGTFYDTCLDQDLSRTDPNVFTKKVTQLCQKRKDRVDQKTKHGESDHVMGGTAMDAAIENDYICESEQDYLEEFGLTTEILPSANPQCEIYELHPADIYAQLNKEYMNNRDSATPTEGANNCKMLYPSDDEEVADQPSNAEIVPQKQLESLTTEAGTSGRLESPETGSKDNDERSTKDYHRDPATNTAQNPTTTVTGRTNRLDVCEPLPTQKRVRHKSQVGQDHDSAQSTAATAADHPRAVRPPRPEACQNSDSAQSAVRPAGHLCPTGSPRTETNQDRTLVAVAPVAHAALAVPVEPLSPDQDPEPQDNLSQTAAKAADENPTAAETAIADKFTENCSGRSGSTGLPISNLRQHKEAPAPIAGVGEVTATTAGVKYQEITKITATTAGVKHATKNEYPALVTGVLEKKKNLGNNYSWKVTACPKQYNGSIEYHSNNGGDCKENKDLANMLHEAIKFDPNKKTFDCKEQGPKNRVFDPGKGAYKNKTSPERELINSGSIMLLHIGTKGQIADIFTKPLQAATFHELRARLTN